jgi:hypothetical protein
MALVGLLRRSGASPRLDVPPAPPHDQLGERLQAAVAADLRAKADNALSYEARVRTMIEDLFAKLEERDAGRRP